MSSGVFQTSKYLTSPIAKLSHPRSMILLLTAASWYLSHTFDEKVNGRHLIVRTWKHYVLRRFCHMYLQNEQSHYGHNHREGDLDVLRL